MGRFFLPKDGALGKGPVQILGAGLIINWPGGHYLELIGQAFKKPLPTIITKLDLPVYFIMGQYDYMTSMNSAKTYFDQIDADKKEFITYDQSAHYPHFEEKEKFSKWMVDLFAK